MYVITSEYESSFLSLILVAHLCMAFDANGLAPPVHEKIRLEGGFLDFDYPSFVFQPLDGLVILVGIRKASWATLRIRIKHFHIKERSAET